MAENEPVESLIEEEVNEVEAENNENCSCDKSNCGCDHELEELEQRIQEQDALIKHLQEENAKAIEKIKVAQAELINYRCRKDKEVSDTLKYCNTDIIKDIIPIVDNFERAIKVDETKISDELRKFLQGFKMIYAGVNEVLKKHDVTEINRLGQIFDPREEQAILTDSIKDKEDEEVLEVLLKGYKLKDRVIRPASVKINNK